VAAPRRRRGPRRPGKYQPVCHHGWGSSPEDEVDPDRLISGSVICPETSVLRQPPLPHQETPRGRPEPVSEINVAQPGRSQSSVTVSGMDTYVARLASPPPTSNYTSRPAPRARRLLSGGDQEASGGRSNRLPLSYSWTCSCPQHPGPPEPDGLPTTLASSFSASPTSATSATGPRGGLGRAQAGRRVDLGLARNELVPEAAACSALPVGGSCPTWTRPASRAGQSGRRIDTIVDRG
jgi:hypothetical protein